MLHGEYRGNPNYCEPYIDIETHEKLMAINNRNIKDNSKPDRIYLFTGLIKCPECGRIMGGNTGHQKRKSGKVYIYKKYRCMRYGTHGVCGYNKTLYESTIEKLLLENVEEMLKNKRSASTMEGLSDEVVVYKYDIEAINAEIDRLNYSWRKGMIRTVEQYERDHDELMEKRRLAEEERKTVAPRDYSQADEMLRENWKEVYASLDEEGKRAFWRSFIESFEPDWMGKEKKIKNIIFF
jgi:adenine-specific DNA methylase